ncbi:MAG: superoxide dismutase [Caulobacteraceae bacterium]
MFKLPELPYPSDALAPVLSDVQMRTHHDKHHAKYIENLNKFLSDSGDKPATLEEVVKASAGSTSTKKLFNNAAQAWNHGFFWECMTPQPAQPSGELAAAIDKAFGGLDAFKAKFVQEGVDHFASGWAWLIARGPNLEVISTHDAATPITEAGVTPLLVCDVWEHAYYLDFKQDRKGFLEQWFDKLVNWSFVEAQYAAATGGGKGYTFPAPNWNA